MIFLINNSTKKKVTPSFFSKFLKINLLKKFGSLPQKCEFHVKRCKKMSHVKLSASVYEDHVLSFKPTASPFYQAEDNFRVINTKWNKKKTNLNNNWATFTFTVNRQLKITTIFKTTNTLNTHTIFTIGLDWCNKKKSYRNVLIILKEILFATWKTQYIYWCQREHNKNFLNWDAHSTC